MSSCKEKNVTGTTMFKQKNCCVKSVNVVDLFGISFQCNSNYMQEMKEYSVLDEFRSALFAI
jgi:hypothetical protein